MEKPRKVLRGELALVFAVIINSFGVVLMLQSQSGISAISSVPYAFSEVLPQLSLGTWTYIFQGLLIASLFILRRKIVPEYLLSFAVGFCFGYLSTCTSPGCSCCPRVCRWTSSILSSATC